MIYWNTPVFPCAYLLSLALILYLFKAKAHVFTLKMTEDQLKCLHFLFPQHVSSR
jgi:hypothetical protein